jgi:hypothetical protein
VDRKSLAREGLSRKKSFQEKSFRETKHRKKRAFPGGAMKEAGLENST